MEDYPTTCNPPAPDGWSLFHGRGGFMDRNGPLWTRDDENGARMLGMRIEERHCNPRHVGHGGWLMTFADMMLPIAAHSHPKIGRQFLPTVSMSTDFLAPVPLGSWLWGRTEVLRVTRNLVFAQGLIYADETLVVRVNGVFKMGVPIDKLMGDADK
ncbi:MAG: PaaI family thioesterase [Hyphomicrobiales bacterium]|nr:PaaI family thioesterase [Hyphomicrobiales bacterium]